MDGQTTIWRVETKTRASTAFAIIATLGIIAGLAAPIYLPRATLQDMFFILTMLALAQSWNLLAGYAGLVSVGQQAFVGLGAYMMFAGVVLLKLDPLVAILLGGIALGLADGPTEAHKVNLAKMLLKGYEAEDEAWPSESLDVRRAAVAAKYGALVEH